MSFYGDILSCVFAENVCEALLGFMSSRCNDPLEEILTKVRAFQYVFCSYMHCIVVVIVVVCLYQDCATKTLILFERITFLLNFIPTSKTHCFLEEIISNIDKVSNVSLHAIAVKS